MEFRELGLGMFGKASLQRSRYSSSRPFLWECRSPYGVGVSSSGWSRDRPAQATASRDCGLPMPSA